MEKTKIKLFLILFFLFSFLAPNLAFGLELQYPRLPGAIPPQDFVNTAPPEQIVSLYVLYIFNLIIWIAGLIALGALVYTGILYLTAGGKPEKVLAAREQITQSFLGIIILLSSYIILQYLNPQLTVVQLPELKPPEVVERPEIPAPEVKPLVSSIDAELPLGRIIEGRIFESYVPPGEQGKPRMTRIKENASTTLKITEELVNLSEKLLNLVKQCHCYDNTVPNPRCTSCAHCPPDECTCDPCGNVRGEIKKTQEKILEKLEELRIGEEKMLFEIKDLKIELDKLERLEIFMRECPPSSLDSLAGFFSKMVLFKDEGWVLRKIKAWDEINIVYYSNKLKQKVYDWATFYCPVGGTFREKLLESATMETSPSEIPPGETPQKILSLVCKSEAPVGEIIDRAKRLGQKLIATLEKLPPTTRKIKEEVDYLQVLVSQCSSKHCFPRCLKIDVDGCECVEIGCFGFPCPIEEVENQVKLIKEVKKILEVIVNGGKIELEEIKALEPIHLSKDREIEIYNQCVRDYYQLKQKIKNCWEGCFFEELNECRGSERYCCQNYTASKLKPCLESCLGPQENWADICLVFRKFLNERIDEFKNCTKACCFSSSPRNCFSSCYSELERKYDQNYYDYRMCVDKCVAERIERELKGQRIEEWQKKEIEEVGVMPIIDKKVPKLLEDLDKEIRKPMSLCVSETIEETTGFLGSCNITVGGISPYKLCCDEQIQEFQVCLEECYLEEGHKKYRECLQNCLKTKLGLVKWCQHYLNFYCCHPQEE